MEGQGPYGTVVLMGYQKHGSQYVRGVTPEVLIGGPILDSLDSRKKHSGIAVYPMTPFTSRRTP